MSPLNSLTPKMWNMTTTCHILTTNSDYYVGFRQQPYWIFASRKVSPRVTEFGDFEHIFTCVDLSYGA